MADWQQKYQQLSKTADHFIWRWEVWLHIIYYIKIALVLILYIY